MSDVSGEAAYLKQWRQQTAEGEPRLDADQKSQNLGGHGWGKEYLTQPVVKKEQRAEAQTNSVVLMGLAAWRAIGRSRGIEQHRLIGAALDVGRQAAIRATNCSNGGRYTRTFSQWLAERGFAEMPRSTRAWTLALYDAGSELTTWFRTLPESKRNRLLQPQSIVGAWKAATRPPRPEDLKRDAKSAWKKLCACMQALPPDERTTLWQELFDAAKAWTQ